MKLMLSKSNLPAFLVAGLMILSSVESTPDIPMPEIVGGEKSDPGEFPYYVYMGPPGCGGALIGPDLVLFAAHCGDYTGRQVVVGAMQKNSVKKGGQPRICETWIGDPKYTSTWWWTDFDFALCKLDEPVEMDSEITLELNFDDDEPKVGDDLVVMGLGAKYSYGPSPKSLHDVTVPVIKTSKCNKNTSYGGNITDSMLCAGYFEGGKDSCQGDSGGPLVKRTTVDGKRKDVHVGVVSWGFGCAAENYPGVYGRTSSRSKWIEKTACKKLKSIAPFCKNEPKECKGDELTINVTTGSEPTAAWELTEEGKTIKEVELYNVPDYANSHKVCLKKKSCYTLRLDGKGFDAEYSVSLNDDTIVPSTTFDDTRIHYICNKEFESDCVDWKSPYQMEFESDQWGSESKISLFLLKNGSTKAKLLWSRGEETFESNTEYTLPADDKYICIKDACYWAVLQDSAGDGMNSGGLEGYVDGELKYTLPTDFVNVTSEVFCSGKYLCKDRDTDILPGGSNCNTYLDVAEKEKKKRCKLEFEVNYYVYYHCQETCGRAGVGSCSWMKNKAQEFEEKYL